VAYGGGGMGLKKDVPLPGKSGGNPGVYRGEGETPCEPCKYRYASGSPRPP